MTYFEAIGVDYQYNATNIAEAEKSFKKSCNKCGTIGKNIICEQCAIAGAHNTVIDILTCTKSH